MVVRVTVPATTANLGPGFDCLGLALSVFNSVTLERSETFGITLAGEGADCLPSDRTNLVYRAVAAVYQTAGISLPPLHVRLVNEVPLRRGLGSSAAAIVGGLVAANALNGFPLDDREILRLACGLEGHPDNVAAALFGGLVVSTCVDGLVEYARLNVPQDVRAVAFIPDRDMPTDRARSVLPSRVSREDAVFNVGRATLLVAAFSTGRLNLLKAATEDRLHQQYRRELFPSMDRFFDAARRAGAYGVFLSGAGSTILALTSGAESQVSQALLDVAAEEAVDGRVATLELCGHGAEVST